MKKILFLQMLIINFLCISCEELELGNADDYRNNIAHTYNAEDHLVIKSVLSGYKVYVEKHPTDSIMVVLNNFHNLGDANSVSGIYKNGIISLENFKTKDGFTIHGKGNVSTDYKSISWTYKVDIGDNEPENFNATFTMAE